MVLEVLGIVGYSLWFYVHYMFMHKHKHNLNRGAQSIDLGLAEASRTFGFRHQESHHLDHPHGNRGVSGMTDIVDHHELHQGILGDSVC